MDFVRKIVLLTTVPMMVLGQTNDAEQASASAPKTDFTRYQTILDRKPFGPEPPNFNPDAPPGSAAAAAAAAAAAGTEADISEEEQQIVSSVRISVLNVTPSGAVAVGFTDSGTQPPVNYYMKVGEKRDVWEVKSADPVEQSVVLVKNGVEATLKVGEAAPPAGKGAKGASGMMRPKVGLHVPAPAAGNAPHPQNAMERLRANRRRSAEDLKAEEERRAAAAEEARKDKERAAAEREQQREALMQIQEELRRQREEREQREAQEAQQKQQQNGEDESP